MNETMKRILAKSTVNAQPESESAKQSPMMSIILKQFGVDPSQIIEYAESLKNGVIGKLSEISERLERIDSALLTLENKLNQVESNQLSLLRDVEIDAEVAAMIATLPVVENRAERM